MAKIYRVVVIGATGQGGFGHGLQLAFDGIERASIVAVADSNPKGLADVGRSLGVKQLYGDYKEMLAKEKAAIAVIAPSQVTNRVPMIEAAAAAGCHIYCEKPVCGTIREMDSILTALKQHDLKMGVAHQWRTAAPVRQTIRDVKAEKYGKLLRIRVRPKDDNRGGGEELLLHGSHLFDMMIALAGHPRWVSGHCQVGERDATDDDWSEGTRPVGPILGDSISALVGFDRGVRGYFESTANLVPRGRKSDNLYGVWIECARAAIRLRQPGDAFVYPAPVVMPDIEAFEWEKVWIQDWHFTRDHVPRNVRRTWVKAGNKFFARDLIAAIEENREPLSSLRDVRFVSEIVQGVYVSHLTGGCRVPLPLAERGHPSGVD